MINQLNPIRIVATVTSSNRAARALDLRLVQVGSREFRRSEELGRKACSSA